MPRARLIAVVTCISFLALGLSPAALMKCCCKARGMVDAPVKSCCQAVKPVKSCCSMQANAMSCETGTPSKGFGPRCKCLDQVQTALVNGLTGEQTHTRIPAMALAMTAPDAATRSDARERSLSIDTVKTGSLILLKTCILTC